MSVSSAGVREQLAACNHHAVPAAEKRIRPKAPFSFSDEQPDPFTIVLQCPTKIESTVQYRLYCTHTRTRKIGQKDRQAPDDLNT